jgi:hypothetical protein
MALIVVLFMALGLRILAAGLSLSFRAWQSVLQQRVPRLNEQRRLSNMN